MSTWCDMISYTAKFMAASIKQHGLELQGKAGESALLVNGRCSILLSNVDNNFVSFQFWDPANIAEKYTLNRYLNCAFDHRGLELSPNMPDSLPFEEQLVGCLKNYDQLLCEGYFDGPLAGDFTWVAAYHALIAEERNLSIARLRLEQAGHPEAKAISLKKALGDKTWMDDVRRILAEKESQS